MSSRPVGMHPANTPMFVPLIGDSIEIPESIPEYGSTAQLEIERTMPQNKEGRVPFVYKIMFVIVACVIIFVIVDTFVMANNVFATVERFFGVTSKRPKPFRSARRASGNVDMHVKLPMATQEKLFVAQTPTDTGVLHNLTACNDVECTTDSNKAKNEDTIHAFLQANPEALLMVFAPWCPACTKALPEYAKAAESSPMPVAIINADMVPQTLLTGPDSLLNLQYFPHVAKHTNGGLSEFDGYLSHENLLRFVADAP